MSSDDQSVYDMMKTGREGGTNMTSDEQSVHDKKNDPDYEWQDGDDQLLFDEGYQEGYESGYEDGLLAVMRTIMNLQKIDLSKVDWAQEREK